MPTQLIYQNTKQILHKGKHDQTVFVSTVNVQKDYGNWHLLLLRQAHSIKEIEQRLVGSEIICWSEVTLCTHELLFQSTSTIKFQQNMLVQYKASIIITLSNARFCPSRYSCNIAHLALGNNQSLIQTFIIMPFILM